MTSVPFFAGSALAESNLWGICSTYNKDYPVKNRQTAKAVLTLNATDLRPLMEKYEVTAVLDRYHSRLEQTFLWVVEIKDPQKLVEFSIELCALPTGMI